MRWTERGFSLIEVLVAVIVLTLGLLTLVQSAAGVTRMLRDGRQRGRAVALATTRLESLRQQALATSPNCTSLAGGSASYPDGFSEGWTVSGAGWSRTVTVTVDYPLGPTTGSQTIRTAFLCQ